ncbi:MAG TPA: glycosyltransferase family 2 protein [Methylibium sp.]|uniref:glycosyltransferase family 2 protein n=1 Tax=Methylibium sp. TaxID=2067992 RepID=UPI002DB96EE8|nr:glycosyltransferase family 2 protein [Methylibium sp.]HEU4459255.1 glycosyltransferase family 2 protein [Methylibium sp.]
MSAIELAWSAITALAAVPALVLLVQVLASIGARAALGGSRDDPAPRPRIAVLMPAHNEQAGIAATLASITPQLRPGDRLLVVADNCSDDTAAIARAAGAEVSERHDTQRRGKGYALDHGVRHLQADAPEIVVMLDADCIAHPGCIDALVRACSTTGRPAQSLYLMEAPPGAGLKLRAAQFAWRVKNQVRALGLWQLGGPCQLMGTGMAFLWTAIREAPLASGHLVEDMQLGVDLALAGTPPRFEPRALVTSRFPDTEAGAAAQRKRWEHGHLTTLLGVGPRLLLAGLLRGRFGVAALALDLMVPPLALLLLAHLGLAAVNLVALPIAGWMLPLALSLGALLALVAAVLLAWRFHGRDLLSAAELGSAPVYVLRKLPIYSAFLFRRQSQWVRAKRENE